MKTTNKTHRLIRLILSSVSASADAMSTAALVLWCLNEIGFWSMIGVSVACGFARGIISGCLESKMPNATKSATEKGGAA